MTRYTKVIETRQYTEVVYYRDDEELGRETRHDDHLYDDYRELMTDEEIEDWAQ